MGEVRFYHLTRTSLDSALYSILEKALEKGMKAIVFASSEAQAETVSTQLWTVQPGGFLPHGTARDGMPEKQPVFIGVGADNPNGATLLVTLDGHAPPDPAAFERSCVLFEEHQSESMARARAAWKALKDAGVELSYWQQGENGGWQKTA